jgi:hypothetical protein
MIPQERKQLGHKTNHSPPFSAEEENGGAIAPLHHMLSWPQIYLSCLSITLNGFWAETQNQDFVNK